MLPKTLNHIVCVERDHLKMLTNWMLSCINPGLNKNRHMAKSITLITVWTSASNTQLNLTSVQLRYLARLTTSYMTCTSDTFLEKLGQLEARGTLGQVMEVVGSWSSCDWIGVSYYQKTVLRRTHKWCHFKSRDHSALEHSKL
jgi:hypothetical protein